MRDRLWQPDLPGSVNWYIPDLAVVPTELARGGGSLVPDQTLLVVEVTSESNAGNDQVLKRRRYGQYGAPLYLLMDRIDRTWTLFNEPSSAGYEEQDGPCAFGEPVRLPAPFDISLDTAGF